MEAKIKTLFIVNPFSGLGRQKRIEGHIQKVLDGERFDYRVVYTERPHHATRLCEEAIKDAYQLIVAVGGDGTVNEVARPLAGTKVAMGIIPSGSGNGLARHLKISTNPAQAIAVINKMHQRKIDTVKVNDRLFVSIAGVGFDAYIAKKYAGQKKRGFTKYAMLSIQNYFAYKPKKYHLTVDGRTLKRRALFISIANSDQFGYNTSIAPNAKIDDGLVDVCIMKKVPWFKTVILAPLLFSQNLHRSSYLEIIRAREVEIYQKKKRINLDGESVKLGQKLHFEVWPLSLIVVTP